MWCAPCVYAYMWGHRWRAMGSLCVYHLVVCVVRVSLAVCYHLAVCVSSGCVCLIRDGSGDVRSDPYP